MKMDNYDVIVETDEGENLVIDVFLDYKPAQYLKNSLLARGDIDDERKIRIICRGKK